MGSQCVVCSILGETIDCVWAALIVGGGRHLEERRLDRGLPSRQRRAGGLLGHRLHDVEGPALRVVQTADLGYQLAGDKSSCCPELESRANT